jgi:DNA mismatch endonuclease (patch repair protein)
MRGNRRSDTTPERALRSLLHASGRRYRKDFTIRAGETRVRADIVFTRQRLAVFVDGCFWHCCPEHGNRPRKNTAYWSEKLARNVARDQRVGEALADDGWRVIRIWEHVPPAQASAIIVAALEERSGPSSRRD